MQTSSYRELHPTSRDSKSNNSDGHSHLDAMPGLQLNDQNMEGQSTIAKGCARQGTKEWSWSQARVNCDGPDLPIVAI